MNALHHKLFRDLGRMRGQMIAISAVLACGIATYITMRGSYSSLLAAREDFYSEYRFANVFAHAKRAPETVARAVANISGVAAAQTRIVTEVTLDIPGLDEPATARLISIPNHRTPVLNDVFLRTGRYLDPDQRDEVLISETFAAANNLRTGDSLLAIMNGKRQRLRIAGIALSPEYLNEVRAGEIFPDNRRFGVMWMSRAAMEAAFDMKAAFNDVALTLTQRASEPEVIAQLDRILERYGSLGAYGRSEQTSARFIADELVELQTMGLILPTLFLGIVAFLLHIVMTRLVNTERSQIAVMKAFGYGRLEVALHYVKFALVAAIPGSIAGIAMGLWLANEFTGLYARYFHFPYLRLELEPALPVFAIAIGAGAACLGALLAVRRAVSLAPAEAMRPESPEQFRAGVVEWSGLTAVLSSGARLVARNLTRRPWRAVATASAIALAVAILVVGRYTIDSVHQVVNLQFSELQREDVTLTFHEQRPSSVRYELERLPGVLRAETFRSVAARLRIGNRSRRIAVLGVAGEGWLRPLLDKELRTIGLPPAGIVLNRYLAQNLGAELGSEVAIEVLEGARPIRHVLVSALVDEPVGLGAYMDAAALSRLLKEEQTVSGAYLQVDSQQTERLYSVLKQMPTVGGVSIKETTVSSFWKSYGETIWISTTMLVGFASVIALGIVYNGARIALSERGHELASLRVLGYTKAEIARILLGEQGVLTLIGIPIGLGLGYVLAVWTSQAISRDLFRLPLVIFPFSYVYAASIVAAAAIASGWIVARRLGRMDLTTALKSRE